MPDARHRFGMTDHEPNDGKKSILTVQTGFTELLFNNIKID